VDLPGLYDRPSIYLDEDGEGYKDEVTRNFSFQRAVLLWLEHHGEFDIVHCHDHHTGLIPFFMQYGLECPSLKKIPSFYTIHNAAYKGMWFWEHKSKLPPYEEEHSGLLDWDGHIHSFASALRCASAFNTVSPSYLNEIREEAGNMDWLFRDAEERSYGILNGIDTLLWDPKNDPLIFNNRKGRWDFFKNKNKQWIENKFNLEPGLAMFCFIGRLAEQKGADILCPAIDRLYQKNKKANFVLLGSGSQYLEEQAKLAEEKHPNNVSSIIAYDEKLAHQLYAGADFIIMPSRFEPCGLNQMFAMRYGTIPVVTNTGGLKDTVKSFQSGGTGIPFENANEQDLEQALSVALDLFDDEQLMQKIIKRCVLQDFSWEHAMVKYKSAYIKLLNE
jgi:starch synthase